MVVVVGVVREAVVEATQQDAVGEVGPAASGPGSPVVGFAPGR